MAINKSDLNTILKVLLVCILIGIVVYLFTGSLLKGVLPALFIGWHFHDNGNKISLAKYTCEPRQYHNCYE